MPHLRHLGADLPRIVVFNKTDLSDPRQNEVLRGLAREKYGESFFLLDEENQKYKGLLRLISKMTIQTRQKNEQGTNPSRVMVVGIPNVGKSTIINRLRALGTERGGGRAVKVGNLPGITRMVSGLVRILDDPETSIYDSPGVLRPKIVDSQQGLNLAITGAIMERTIDDYLLVDYTLHVLNQNGLAPLYKSKYGLTEGYNDVVKFINDVAKVNGMTSPEGVINTRNTVVKIMKDFRDGELGRLTIDTIDRHRL